MANSYTKKLGLSFSLDQQNINKIKEEVKGKLANIKLQLDGEVSKRTASNLEKFKSKQQHVEDVKEAMNALKNAGILGKLMSVGMGLTDKTYQMSKFKEGFDKAFKKVGDDIKSKLSKVFDDFIDGFKAAVDEIASYTSTQYKFSQKAWSTYKETGLTGADAYAYQKAMSDVGANSIEDLSVWMGTTEGAEAHWKELIELYKSQYEQGQETAKLWQQFQQEFSMFKQEMYNDILKWMSENKETIKNVLKFALDVFKGLANVIGGIVSFFGGGNDEVSASEVVNKYVNTPVTNNTNFGITVNGVDNPTAAASIVNNYIQTRYAIR